MNHVTGLTVTLNMQKNTNRKVLITTVSLSIINICIPLRTEFPVFWEFLGIPRNSQKFPTMQINSDLKSLELLGKEDSSFVRTWNP